jgi:sugar lactone lactonase YvrE
VADTDADTRDEGSSDGGLAHDSDVAHVAEVGIPMLKLLAGGLDGPEDVDGTGAAARFYAPEGVASDGAGNLFVADTGNRTIRKVVIATGAVTTLAGFAGSQGSADGMGAVARFSTPGGVASDGVGNLFVADSWNHTIRKVVIATGAVTTLAGSAGNYGEADGTGAAALFYAPAGVVSDGAGNLFVADSYNHTIRKVVITTGAVTTLAGSAGSQGSADGTGAAARFNDPQGVVSDGAGNLFVGDSGSCTIRKVVIATGAVTTLAGSAGNRGSADGTGPAAQFGWTYAVASDGAGNLFVADQETIRKVVIATGAVTTLAGSAIHWGSADGTGAAAQFNYLEGVASDGAGNLFVADHGNDTIRKVVIATGAVTTLAGSPNWGSADGKGAAARFVDPEGVASDGAGNLFVADSGNRTIRKVSIATGAVTTLAGSAGSQGSADGTGAAAQFSYPIAVASDGAGNLFVADYWNDTIRKVVIATGAVTTLAGSPQNPGSVDGVGTDARFNSPDGVASDGAGNLFVADSGNRTIRRVVIATGAVTTLAGSAGSQGSADGTGAAARFSVLLAVASDGVGNLFVADQETIRKVVIATGAVTTLAGSAGNVGSADGTGTAARFFDPDGVASDGAGNLFVADLGNSTIRKVVIATGVVTTVVGSPSRDGFILGPLPAGLYQPSGLAFGPTGELFITGPNTVLVAQF